MSKHHAIYTVLILIFLIIFAIIILVGMIELSNDFLQELAHINIEIKRTRGKEREYFKKSEEGFGYLFFSLLNTNIRICFSVA